MEYGEPFADDPLPAHLDDADLIRRHNQRVGPHGSLEILKKTGRAAGADALLAKYGNALRDAGLEQLT